MRESKMLPNFLIVGAAKSGTTSLFRYLDLHPQVFIPERKECRFFSEMDVFDGPNDHIIGDTVIKDLKSYEKLYNDAIGYKAIGDASVDYLYFYEKSIQNILRFIGNDIKIIILLRNPVDRAYSNYLHFVRNGVETLSFKEALQEESRRKQMKWKWSWRYLDIGFYYSQVKAYIENFENVKIYLYDEFKIDASIVLKDILIFLELEEYELNVGGKFNVSGFPRNKTIHWLLTNNKCNLRRISRPFMSILPRELKSWFFSKLFVANLEKPPMDLEIREYLTEIYTEDILKLQRLIEKDLTGWLKNRL